MNKKDLKSNWYDCQLALLFIQAHKEILGKTIRVGEENMSRLRVLEDDLHEHGIDSMEYAYTVVAIMKKWISARGFHSLPVKVFCGPWCMNRYLEVTKSISVTVVDTDKTVLLQNELLVARKYISDNIQTVKRMMDVVTEISGLLSNEWLMLYTKKERGELISDCVEILCKEYNVNASDYNGIIGKLL
jgi:hypothetical protein